jgi:hypothetical protein
MDYNFSGLEYPPTISLGLPVSRLQHYRAYGLYAQWLKLNGVRGMQVTNDLDLPKSKKRINRVGRTQINDVGPMLTACRVTEYVPNLSCFGCGSLLGKLLPAGIIPYTPGFATSPR